MRIKLITGLFFLVLLGCATHIQLGPNTYTLPSEVPNFSEWFGSFFTLYSGQKASVTCWVGENPVGAEEKVIVFNLVKQGGDILILFLIYKPPGTEKPRIYVDKALLDEGQPSFRLTPSSSVPDLTPFLQRMDGQEI